MAVKFRQMPQIFKLPIVPMGTILGLRQSSPISPLIPGFALVAQVYIRDCLRCVLSEEVLRILLIYSSFAVSTSD